MRPIHGERIPLGGLRRDGSVVDGAALHAGLRRARGTDPTAVRREALSVAIASGKGGTGKSFLATNLAVLAARRGFATTLVDCDFGLAADHLLLGIQPVRTLQDLFEGRAPARDCRLETSLGARLVAGATGVQELANLDRIALLRLAAGLAEWAAGEDLLLLDAGAGIGAQSLATVVAADHVVIVVQPEIAALTDAYALAKCLVRRPPPVPSLSIVVNRTTSSSQGLRAHRKIADVAARFLGATLHYLGAIAEEPAISPRRLGQPPLAASHPTCRTAEELTTILERLHEVTAGIGPRLQAPDAGIEARLRQNLGSLR